jgi:hypothetical protein
MDNQYFDFLLCKSLATTCAEETQCRRDYEAGVAHCIAQHGGA